MTDACRAFSSFPIGLPNRKLPKSSEDLRFTNHIYLDVSPAPLVKTLEFSRRGGASTPFNSISFKLHLLCSLSGTKSADPLEFSVLDRTFASADPLEVSVLGQVVQAYIRRPLGTRRVIANACIRRPGHAVQVYIRRPLGARRVITNACVRRPLGARRVGTNPGIRRPLGARRVRTNLDDPPTPWSSAC